MMTEPIRTVLLPIALGAFAAAAQAFVDGANTRGIIIAALGVLIVAAQEYSRSKVTPVGGASRLAGERGYGLVEVAFALLIVIVALILLTKYV